MNFIESDIEKVVFTTMSGDLTVLKKGELYGMDFPAYDLTQVDITTEMIEAIGATPVEAYMGRDLLCTFNDEIIIKRLKSDMDKLEDPVCGSGHCHIAPYWIDKLNKKSIVTYQASARGGTRYCSGEGTRVKLSGKAALYSTVDINIK